MSFINERTEEYYKKFIELQEKLRKSEEERLQLEMKFNDMMRVTKDEEQKHYRKLRSQYKFFLEEDRRRQDRNEKLIRCVERIESRIAMLVSKTERFKFLRQQYHMYLSRISGQKPNAESSSAAPQIQITHHNKPEAASTTETRHQQKEPSADLAGDKSDTADLILKNYLQNLSSQKVKDLLIQNESGNHQASNSELRSERTPFTLIDRSFDFHRTEIDGDDYRASYEEHKDFRPNYANSIADDIINSIYSKQGRRTMNNSNKEPPTESLKEASSDFNVDKYKKQLVKSADRESDIAASEENDEDVEEIQIESPPTQKTASEDVQKEIREDTDIQKPEHISKNIDDFKEAVEAKEESVASVLLSEELSISKPETILEQPKLGDEVEFITPEETLVNTQELIQSSEIIEEPEIDNSVSEADIQISALPIEDQNESLGDGLKADQIEDIPKPREISEAQYEQEGYLQDYQQYDESGQPIQPEYDDSQYQYPTDYQYDENGQLIQQYNETDQSYLQYDENGQPIQQYDANGQPYQQEYDENGQYQQYGSEYQQYDENGQPLQQYQEYSQEYDEQGQPIQQYNYENYNENGEVIQQPEESAYQPQSDEQSYQQTSENIENIQQLEPAVDTSPVPNEEQHATADLSIVPEEHAIPAAETIADVEPEQPHKPSVLDMLDTDTESTRQDPQQAAADTSKVSNESDFDFSNN